MHKSRIYEAERRERMSKAKIVFLLFWAITLFTISSSVAARSQYIRNTLQLTPPTSGGSYSDFHDGSGIHSSEHHSSVDISSGRINIYAYTHAGAGWGWAHAWAWGQHWPSGFIAIHPSSSLYQVTLTFDLYGRIEMQKLKDNPLGMSDAGALLKLRSWISDRTTDREVGTWERILYEKTISGPQPGDWKNFDGIYSISYDVELVVDHEYSVCGQLYAESWCGAAGINWAWSKVDFWYSGRHAYLVKVYIADKNPDNTSPSTTISVDGPLGENGWYTGSTSVTLTPTDNSGGYGMKYGYTKYKVDGGSERDYSSPFPISGDDVHKVDYRSADGAYNLETWKSKNIKIDTTPPSTPNPTCGSGWSNDNTPRICWSASSDSGSGVAGYYWKVDGGSETWTTSTCVTLPLQSDGSHTFCVRAKDKAGLLSGWGCCTFRIDTTAPSTPSPDDGVEGWSDDDTPTFTWSASSDTGSGVAGYYWKVDGGSETWTTSTSVTLPPQSDGSHTFYVKAKDKAGNVGSWGSHGFQIDTTAPSTPSPDDGVEGWSNDNTPTFTWSPSSDSGSGVAGYYWKVDTGSETWTTSTSVTLPPQPEDGHTFYVKAEDKAGLLSGWGSHDFQIDDDITPPDINNPSSSFTAETDAYRIQIDALDSSGISIVRFRYRFGTASYSEWYAFTSSWGDTYWHDIPKAKWETHAGETIHWQVYAEDSDDDRPDDFASSTSPEYVMFYLTVSTSPPEVDNVPADSGMGWYDAGELAYAKCTPQVFVGTDSRSFFKNWSGDAAGNNPTSDPIVMDGPKTAIANYKTQYRVSIEPKSHDNLLILHPNQIQIYGAPPNDTLITLTSYSEIWLDNVEWTAKQILWQGNNVVPDPNPQFSPTLSGTWVITCRVYKITSITFNDHSGKELYALPAQVTITAPNNTDISLSSFSDLALYLQNGTYTFKTITWQSNNVVDSPPQTFDPTNGDPSINCRVYSLQVTCVDNSDQPLANASLTILFPNSTVLSKYSNQDGIYYAPQIQNGSYSIAVDWQDVSVGNALIHVVSDVDQSIPCRVYILTVRVRDEIGQPLSGAILYLYRNETLLNGKYGLPPAPATDIEGCYTWHQMSKQLGSYKVKAVFTSNGLRKVGWSDEQPLTEDTTKKNAWSVQTIPIIDVNIQTIDWEDEVLSDAYVEIVLDKTVQAWGYTDLKGWINFTDIVPGSLTFNVYWMEVRVNQTMISLASDSTITLRCEVYNVVIGFRDTDGDNITNPWEYTLKFLDGTESTLEVFAFRCPVGNVILKSAIWHGTEVAPSPNQQINVNATKQYFFYLDVFNPTFSVKEPDRTTPSAYSTIHMELPNGTIRIYPTDSNGQITLKIQRGSCYVNVTTLDGYVAQVNYPVSVDFTKIYEVPTTRVLIDQTKVSSHRCDVDNVQIICLHATWVHNGSDVVGGLICVNETSYIANATGWIIISISYDTVGKRTWIATSVDCGGITRFGKSVEDPCITWDRIKITEGGVTQSFTNITSKETVWLKAIYECDSATFDGTKGMLYVNGFEMTWSNVSSRWEYSCTFDTVGERTFIISNVSDESYGLTTINNSIGPQTITWLVCRTFEVVFEGGNYDISIASNSAFSNFAFDPSESQIDFEVSGVAGTTGTCNVTIPKGLIAYASDIKVYIDEQETDFTLWESADSYHVYVTYQHSMHVVTISFVPSVFPWWILLIVIVVVLTAAGLTMGRKRMKKQ